MAESKRILLGMSGGVDSSVAAALLLRAGWEVIGLTCDFCGRDKGADGQQDDAALSPDAQDANRVCEVLGIPHVYKDCSQLFDQRVVEPFCRAYMQGLTPSPCVDCNATMKLPMLAAVADELGATHIATGHYARVVQLLEEDGALGRFALKTALDNSKDQSYMLSMVPQALLSRLVLPLGGMTKTDVRLYAEELGLPVAQRPDSQDLCFAPDGYKALLAQRGVVAHPGNIVDVSGKVLGTHTGLQDYTYGQRGGLGIGGAPEPYYVTGKDADTNTLTVGFAADARMGGVLVSSCVWQAFVTPPTSLECSVKLRYRTQASPCIIETAPALEGEASLGATLHTRGEDAVLVRLLRPEALTSPGQIAVFYCGDTVLGGGVISAVLPVGFLV